MGILTIIAALVIAYLISVTFLTSYISKVLGFIPMNALEIPESVASKICYLYFRFIRRSYPKRVGDYEMQMDDIVRTGFIPMQTEVDLDNVQLSLPNPDTVDGVLFTGADKSGTSIVIRINRRPNRLAEVWLYLRLPDGRQYTLPQHPDTMAYSSDAESFTGAGIMMECIEPMRRWRVAFNGLLRCGSESFMAGDNEETVHTFFSLRWAPVTYIFDHKRDLDPCRMTQIIMEEGFDKIGMIDKLLDYSEMDRLDMWGMLQGNVMLDEEEVFIAVNGLRTRQYTVLNWGMVNKFVEFMGYMEDGSTILIGCSDHQYGFSNFRYGYSYRGEGKYFPLEDSSLTLDMFDEVLSRNAMSISYTYDNGIQVYLGIAIDNDGFVVNAGERWECRVQVYTATFKALGKTGRGFVMLGLRTEQVFPYRPALDQLLQMPKPLSEQAPYVLDHTDERCRLTSEVGGKGASLATLTSMKQDQFLVPPGFSITAEAYWKQLKEQQHLQNAVLVLDAIACQRQKGDIVGECQRVMDQFHQTPMVQDIVEEIKNHLWKLYGPAQSKVMLAVRSSAVGEDSADLSAAGQNETFLGVKGVAEIEIAVRKCWASQFAFQAVSYRRQHGQWINCGMSVVIQEMIPSEVAGVMFTRDPLTGNPDTLTITANYGLGESVVSASADPDTIHIKRTWNNKLSIKHKIIGDKGAKMQVKADGGTETIKLTPGQSQQCCIPDDLALKLAEIGIMAEHAFGDARDIEFGVSRGQIYMLQARPITSLYPETEEEMFREFNSALKTDHEFPTNANLGEVFRGATTPLGTNCVVGALDFTLQYFGYIGLPADKFTFEPYYMYGHVSSGRQAFWNTTELIAVINTSCEKFVSHCLEIAFFGRVMNCEEVYKVMYERYGPPSFIKSIKQLYRNIMGVIFHGDHIDYLTDLYMDWQVPLDDITTAEAANDKINEYAMPFYITWVNHILSTSYSSFLNGCVVQMLCSTTNGEFTLDVYGDLALLQSCNTAGGIESANVPKALANIAGIIMRDPEARLFAQMDRDSGCAWLQEHPGEVGDAFKEFLNIHGHRCLKEYDLYSTPWGVDPRPVVENLLEMVRHPSSIPSKKRIISVEQAVSELKCPVSWWRKCFLKFIVPKAQRGVSRREKTKSLVIRVNDRYRKAYRKLAAMMVAEGRLPNEDYLFFCTVFEIKELIRTRSPRIVGRAVKRHRIHDYLNSLIYEDWNVGWPKPVTLFHNIGQYIADQKHRENRDVIKDAAQIRMQYANSGGFSTQQAVPPASQYSQPQVASSQSYPTAATVGGSSGVRVDGTPVSQGVVTGPARVILELRDAVQIQQGEILITFATDIAWSPYFPMLAGVVTELGGLISHGAVVAREYGLPCIVGAKNATSVFQSGDTVVLNATKGFVEKSNN